MDNFGESAIVIRTITKTQPGRHLQVEWHLRKLLKNAFDRTGIEMPFTQRVVTLKLDEVKEFLK